MLVEIVVIKVAAYACAVMGCSLLAAWIVYGPRTANGLARTFAYALGIATVLAGVAAAGYGLAVQLA